MKTEKTGASVKKFLDGIEDDQRRADAKAFDKLVQRATGEKPKMWGDAIVGYGDTTLTYANGKEVEWMALGFSPRSASLTLYLNDLAKHAALLEKLGPHKTTKACLHIKRLSEVDAAVLESLVKKAYADAG
jgi:hypothetical protein